MFRQGSSAREQVHAVRHLFDPNILDTAANIFVATTGAVATTGTAPNKKWRVNADSIFTYDTYYPVIDVEFVINVPTAPATGDSKSWGLRSPAAGNRGRVGFDITDDVFSAVVYDDHGNSELSAAITWVAAWSNAEVRYRIIHDGRTIRFFTAVASATAYTEQARYPSTANGQASNVDMPLLPMPLHMQNDDTDNMDVDLVVVRMGFNV